MERKILTVIFLLLPLMAFSQKREVYRADYDTSYGFVNYSANHLHYSQDSSLMNAFFEKWVRVVESGQGNLNIVHIGGSHVQGGMLPHRIRMNILRNSPNSVAGRGMIFPYSAGKNCNNPYDYKTIKSHYFELTRNVYKSPEHDMGLCGIAITARDSHEVIGVQLNEPEVDFATNQVVIFGESESNVVPVLIVNERTITPSYIDKPTRRFVFNLSSTVEGFSIMIPTEEGQSFTLQGLCLNNKNSGISYHSIGVNGAAVPDYLKCRYFTQDLRLLHPDCVVFGIGINDASGVNFDTVVFKNNYLRLVDSIKTINPDCAFIFITNNDSFKKVKRHGYVVNENGALARDVFYRLAQETNGCVWDQFEVMGGLKSMDKWRIAKLAQTDRVHFTRAGYELVGDLFYNALMEQYSIVQENFGKFRVQSKSKSIKPVKPSKQTKDVSGSPYISF